MAQFVISGHYINTSETPGYTPLAAIQMSVPSWLQLRVWWSTVALARSSIAVRHNYSLPCAARDGCKVLSIASQWAACTHMVRPLQSHRRRCLAPMHQVPHTLPAPRKSCASHVCRMQSLARCRVLCILTGPHWPSLDRDPRHRVQKGSHACSYCRLSSWGLF